MNPLRNGWKEEKSEDGDAHISQEEKKKPSKNQVIKLFMKLYEKNERKEGRSEAQRDR